MDKTASKPRRNRLAVFAVAGLAVVSMTAGAMSLALFTDTADVDGNTFSTGSVDISTTPTTALVTFSAMAPGDQVTAPLTVDNDGTLDLRYAITSAANDTDGKGLKDQLVMTIKTGVTACTNVGFTADGASIYSGDLDGTAGVVVGSTASGAQAGDRTLVATTGTEVLCFNVSLPLNTDSTFQGATTTAVFTFDAEQTKNN